MGGHRRSVMTHFLTEHTYQEALLTSIYLTKDPSQSIASLLKEELRETNKISKETTMANQWKGREGKVNVSSKI